MSIAIVVMTIFLPITMVAVFAFTSVASWADARRREREAFYKSETLKKIAESSGGGATAALEIMREQERTAQRNKRENQRLGGIINIAVGIALMIFLKGVASQAPVYLVGLIPLLVGVALLVYVISAKKES